MIDLSSVKVYDNLLDDRFILDIDEESNRYHWVVDNVANRKSFPNQTKGSHKFLNVSYYSIEKTPPSIVNLFSFLSNNILYNKFNINSISLNLQTIGLNGQTHCDSFNDPKKYTLLVFINHIWEKNWGGQFQIMDNPNIIQDPHKTFYLDNKSSKELYKKEKVIKSIKYKPGRVILFPSNIPHRGLAPSKPYIFRKSLVYRLSLK